MKGEAEDAREPAPRSPRITALDGLRGLAASSVVLAHAVSVPAKSMLAILLLTRSPMVIIANGVGGVHVFFVLSGYCLSSSASRVYRARGLAQFYARRIMRIYPPYVAGLLIAWGLSGGVFDKGDGGGFLSDHIVDLRRLHMPIFKMKWALMFPGEAFGQIPVGWTLYVEMIFSFLLPFMLWIATRAHWLLLVAIAIPALIFAPDSTMAHRVYQPSFARYTLDFALGIGIYCERERVAWLFDRIRSWGSAGIIIAGVLLLSSPRYYNLDIPFPKTSALLYMTGAALLVAAAIHSSGFRRFLSLGPIAWVGRISFSVYLIHTPIILLLTPWIDHRLGFWGATLFVVACLFTTYLIAPILYHFVEVPSMKLGYRLSDRIGGKTVGGVEKAA